MGIFSKKRRNNDTELRDRCIGGLITIYRLLVVKVGEEEMKKFSESSTYIRAILNGHIDHTYSYLADSDPMQWNDAESKFVFSTLNFFMQKEGINWDTDAHPNQEDQRFYWQGKDISKALLEEKDPDKWESLIEETAENITKVNAREEGNEIQYGDIRDFLERDYDVDGNEIELSKEDGEFAIHMQMLGIERQKQKGMDGIRRNAEKGHITSCVYMWVNSKDDIERKKWDDIVGFNLDYLEMKGRAVAELKKRQKFGS